MKKAIVVEDKTNAHEKRNMMRDKELTQVKSELENKNINLENKIYRFRK